MADSKAYTVGWICALPTEFVAAQAFLDEEHDDCPPVAQNDNNNYALGKIGRHNVVIAVLPDGEYGTNAAGAVARDMLHSFPNVRIGLMVGIGGGAPSSRYDVRLGDVVVSSREGGKGGVFQYDFGKAVQNQDISFQHTGFLNQPPTLLRTAVSALKSRYRRKGHQLNNAIDEALERWPRLRGEYSRPPLASDRLYRSEITHPYSSEGCAQVCSDDPVDLIPRAKRGEHTDDPAIHYGLIACANQLMKNAMLRDKLATEYDVVCFELEAAGLMNHFPCIVIRGICDYSDSHKNKEWQGFAAMTASAYAKDLLRQIPPNRIEAEKPIREVLGCIHEDVQRLNQTTNETKMAVEIMHSEQRDFLIDLRQGVQDLKLSKVEDLLIACNPHFVVPFPSDPDFVNRSDIWTWIEEQYAGPESRFALVGLGGFGKSQMAIRFAHHLHATSPKTSVFWVHGSTKATFEESYRSIADVLALPRRHDPDVNVLVLVRDWLQRENVSPWLMIIDNADDIKMLLSKDTNETYLSYLPKRENSKILITSRNLDAAERLTGSIKMIYTVLTMEDEQTLQLLQKKLGRDVNEAAAIRLSRALGRIPLAVNQAAAYINKRSPRVTILSYLDEFQKSENRKGTLLRSDRGDIRRYDGVSNSIIVTWQVTFEQIKREQPRAANLLSLMSYFHAQNIPDYMLHNYSSSNIDSEKSNVKRQQTSSDDFEDDLDVLRGYSLITITATPGLLEMHSLVQFCTKVWISEFGSPDQWKTLFLQSASEHFPSGVFGTWQQCQMLMPHVQPLLDKEPSEERNWMEWGKLLMNVSRYLVMIGNDSKAEVILQQVVSTRAEILGQEHPSTLTSMTNLSSAISRQGRLKEAEELDVRVMETRNRVLGEEHPDTLTSMANLASTFSNQGRWKEAEKLQSQAMGIWQRVLGEEHPNTLTSMANLALTFWNQGRWKEAEELEVRVMGRSLRVLGEEHPTTLTSMANLASTYRNQGRWKEAEKLEVQVMETNKRVLGEEHPDTLASIKNLALTHCNQGRWKEAEELDVRVMETSKRVLGEEHPHTLASMNNLASTYRDQNRCKEAEELEVWVMERNLRVLGEEHPTTLTIMATLALTYRHQGRWKEAEELEVRVMERSKRVLGEEHPDTLVSMANLASTYRSHGQFKEAEELDVRVMETSKRVLGEEHPDTLVSMANLASTYRSQGRLKEAEELGVRVMETRKRVLGEKHPHTLSSINYLALLYGNQGQWKQAERLHVWVMEVEKSVLGEEHVLTLASMANLVSTLWNQSRWKEAEELEVRVMETRKRVLGEEHPATLRSMSNLASMYCNQGRWKEAEELEVQVMEMSLRVLGEEHPHTLASMNDLASTYRKQGRWKEVEELNVRVMETRKRVLGEDHPDTLTSMHNLAFTWKDLERWEDAIQLLQDCVRHKENVLGVDHPDTKYSLSSLSDWKLEFRGSNHEFP
ncbi:Kinesin light chain 5 [Colletotrichum musicola]|uniref:Kinesin light chain 5 n=1 Tax=Colletotrichum musicola TaxID=2175873 RepID=A0A8H6KM16_9PEZI|nr:Kinesin light chain 5 [Colletotrichum musicola]